MYKRIFLFLSLFLFVSSLTYLERRRKLADNLKKTIESRKKDKTARPTWIMSVYKYSRILFYGVKKERLPEIQHRFSLSDKIVSQLKTAPYMSSGVATLLDQSNVDLSGDLTAVYNEFYLSLGTAFAEGDMIYFLLMDLRAHMDLNLKGEVIWFEECRRTFLFKDCWQNRRVEIVPFTAEEQFLIKNFVDYTLYMSLVDHVKYLEDDNIQAYISENTVILSDDDKAAVFIGNFGDIAIGPKKYLSSVEPIKKVWTTSQGHSEYCIKGEYVTFCDDKDFTDISCKKVYGGMYVHKFKMLLNKINPYSTMEKHRTLMETNAKNGPYTLIMYSDGQLEYRTVNTKVTDQVLWTSGTKGKGVAPYEIKVSSDYRLQLFDATGQIIYQSGDYINVPSIRYGGMMQNAEYLFRYNGYQGGRMKGGVLAHLGMGIDDENFQQLTANYWIYRHDGSWTKNKSPFQILGGTRIYYPYSLKITLEGSGAEKFKICYKTSIRNQKDKTRNRESPFACNGQATEIADFEAVSDYISGFEVIILPAGDNRIE